MSRLVIIFLMIFLSSINLVSQENTLIDSLLLLADNLDSDVNKVNLLNEIAYQLKNCNDKEALSFAEDALELADSIGHLEGKALAFMRLGLILDESFYFTEAEIAYNQLIDFEKDGHKKVLSEMKEIEKEKQNQMLIGIGLLLFISLLGSIAAFIAYRNRQRQLLAEYQTAEAEYQIEQAYQKIDDLMRNQELITANARLAGRDDAQKKIAKDLHDGLLAILTTVKLYYFNIDKHLKTDKLELRQHYQKASELLDKSCSEVRRISHELISETLQKVGLVDEVKSLIVTIHDSQQIQAKVYVNGMKDRLDVKWESKVFKIIQELVGNVLKHANASKLDVQLNEIEDKLNILVEDNGSGFNSEEAMKKEGIGLRNIMLRVTDLEGSLYIDSVKGRGTTVSIDLPIPKNGYKEL